MAAAVDATISAISELGYHRTTMREICHRAGLSQGAVTRHFPTRLDLIAAAADEVAKRQEARYLELVAEAPPGPSLATTAVTILRNGTRHPLNAVWLELAVAARTTPELAARMGPAVEGAYARTMAMASLVPGASRLDPLDLKMVVMSLVHLFNGEVLSRAVVQMPEVEDRRLEVVTAALAQLLAAAKPALPG
jgi:AcrR family transcriptional regulator